MTDLSPLAITASTSDFTVLRRQGGYYVDKTRQLAKLLDRHFASVSQVIVRPRAFGKTLTLTALKAFVELNYQHPGQPTEASELFADLEISRDRELCAQHQCQTPVVYVSFQDIVQNSLEEARTALYRMMAAVVAEYAFLLDEPRLESWEREHLQRLVSLADDTGTPTDKHRWEMNHGLQTLARCLYAVYKKPVMFLIDEYDTPLFYAASCYSTQDNRRPYESMFCDMLNLLINVCKPDDSAVGGCLLAGSRCTCLATMNSGINNLSWDTVECRPFAELMGFTDAEVRSLLAACGLGERLDEARAWYGGYRCGPAELHHPGSLIRYCLHLHDHPGAGPRSFRAEAVTRDLPPLCMDDLRDVVRLQRLLDGEYLPMRGMYDVRPLDCDRLDASHGRCWSSPALLKAAGYIAWQGDGGDRDEFGRPMPLYRLPNREIVDCLCRQVRTYFRQGALHGDKPLARFMAALFSGDDVTVYEELQWCHHHHLRLPQPGDWQPRPRPEPRPESEDAPLRWPPPALHGLDCPHLTLAVLRDCEGEAVSDLSMTEPAAAEPAALSCIDARDPGRGCLLLFVRAAELTQAAERDAQQVADWRRALNENAAQALELACSPAYGGAFMGRHAQLRQLACYGISWSDDFRNRRVTARVISREGAAGG